MPVLRLISVKQIVWTNWFSDSKETILFSYPSGHSLAGTQPEIEATFSITTLSVSTKR